MPHAGGRRTIGDVSRRTACLLLALSGCATARPAPAPACALDVAWVQETLRLWERTTAEVLRLPAAPLPTIVWFDARCSYTLGAGRPSQLRFRGAPVLVEAAPHQGTIRLPSGATLPPRPHAAASMGRDGRPFFAMPLLDVWRAHVPDEPNLSEIMLGVAQHELVHTLQLPGILATADAISKRLDRDLTLDDDQIERLYEGDPEYVAAFRAEVDLLWQAARAPSAAESRALARQALALARSRQARWFTGDAALHRELDGLFLSMEGLGEWARHELMTAGPIGGMPRLTSDEAVRILRGREPSWSQDEGLAILLVLEKLHPTFRERLLAPALPDAFALLDEAVAGE